MKQESVRRQSGFTLLELAVLMVILGGLLVIAVAAIPRLTERARLDTTSATMEDVAGGLVSFAAIHARLPCPDINGDGLEGTAGVCAVGDEVGEVPYRTLGLSDPVWDGASQPVRYAVYRNSADIADLAAVVPNRFIPVLPGDPATLTTYSGPGTTPYTMDTPTKGINKIPVMPDERNDLDFCLALRHAKEAAPNSAYVNTSDFGGAAGAFSNSAFVLASGGVEDADGDGVFRTFDGLNEGGGVEFESPARGRNSSGDPSLAYDDLVVAMPFGQLESQLSCAAVTIAVTSGASVAIAAAHGLVWGEDGVWSGRLGQEAALIAQIMSDVALVTATITLVVAAIDLGVLITGCAGTPDDDCVGVGFATAAVVLAAIAEGLAIATVVVTAIALDAANTALDAAETTIPGLYEHAQRTRIDALFLDAHGGQW